MHPGPGHSGHTAHGCPPHSHLSQSLSIITIYVSLLTHWPLSPLVVVVYPLSLRFKVIVSSTFRFAARLYSNSDAFFFVIRLLLTSDPFLSPHRCFPPSPQLILVVRYCALYIYIISLITIMSIMTIPIAVPIQSIHWFGAWGWARERRRFRYPDIFPVERRVLSQPT